MQVGMVGLGRMGANLVRRLLAGGHSCVAFDRDPTAVAGLVAEGAAGAATLAELVDALEPPRAVWLMLPAAITGRVIDELVPLLDADDVVIDGGNSFYRDDVDRARTLAIEGIHHVDCGTSGGVWGLERGFCLMIGGEDAVVERLEPVWRTLAPGLGTVERTPGAGGDPGPGEEGFLHCGPNGAGHFVKMVHNGIEYGLMAAYAEGLNVLRHADVGLHVHDEDAETAPLRDPEYYRYEIDTAAVAEVWRRGSVVSSWLLDLTAAALRADPDLDEFTGRVSDSGEGRWTMQAAIDEGIPTAVLAAALHARFTSQGHADDADRMLSAMRRQFGGHHEKG
jgi:6-phosphogluconate dehydrogenase